MPQKSSLFWLNWALIGLAVLLVIVNTLLILGNRERQQTVNANQQRITESNALAQVNQALIQALVGGAVNRNDEQIRKLLGEAGITFSVSDNPAPAPDAGTAPASPPAAPAQGGSR
jgi:inner membrane protein involved in colicin E2 resistance